MRVPCYTSLSKPHFSTDLLIALAIRNINKNIGAYMKDVIAFLCLFFPYYNNNRDECWKLVTRHAGEYILVTCPLGPLGLGGGGKPEEKWSVLAKILQKIWQA